MYTLPELPYAYNALEPFIDEMTMKIHHDKHHATYIKNLNEALVGNESLLSLPVEALIRDLSVVPESIRARVRNNAGGHANHSLFWKLMAPNGEGVGGSATGALAKAIGDTFGDFSIFTEKFATTAMSRFGSGWVWLVVDGGKLDIIDTPYQDSPLMEGKSPVLALDVWEHAYYLKYQNMRAEYVKQWWNVVNWTYVNTLFAASSK